jgi:molybdopterin-guanine dinucleotide biosynthesis protein A
LSGRRESRQFAEFDLEFLPDSIAGEGPLAGILAALGAAEVRGFSQVASFPCDTPFFPLDIVARLMAGLDRESRDYAVAASPTGEHRIFAVWPTACRVALETAFIAGLRKVEDVEKLLPKHVVEFSAADQAPQGDSFFNINSLADLEVAEAWLAARGAAS